MENNLQALRTIEEHIMENRLKEALFDMKLIFEKHDQEDLVDESILILSRMKNLENKSNTGVVDYFDNEYNKIRLSVIKLRRSVKKLLESTSIASELKTPSNTLAIIFEENFDNNDNNWWTGEDEKMICYIKNRRYFLENTSKGSNQRSSGFQELKIDTIKNFTIKCRITFIGGPSNEGYGLNWGWGEETNHFQFLISSDGSFVVSYFIDNEWFPIAKWTESDTIKTGKSTNSLEVIKSGNIINYKINNEVVFTSDFISFFGDDFAFSCSSGIKIAVDYLQVLN